MATMVGGTAALVTVVTAVLALITSFTWTIPILAAIVAVACWLLFRRAVGR
jgi:ABC-type transport system involved in multi-copper enzyme maturation permease subunit